MCQNNCNGKECSRCGDCCAFSIPITRKEEKRIKEYIIQNNIEPENLFENNDFYCRCCFYDAKNKLCKIYPVRPNICRSYKCNRNEEELEKEKVINHEKSYWNHIGKDDKLRHLTSFDLLFYNNPKPLLALLFNTWKDNNEGMSKERFEQIKKVLYEYDLGYLASSLEINEEVSK